MVRVGLQTSDDFRFVRAWWEVSPVDILDGGNGPAWQLLCMGILAGHGLSNPLTTTSVRD